MTGAKQNLTDSQLAVDLREGVRTQTVPSNLEPPLALVHEDRPLIQRDGCFVRDTGVVSEACAYGDTASNTVTVLFGDSHAASWFPALDTISKQKHWRLVVLAKAGCPAEEVNVIRGGGVYTTCAEWRSNAMQRIATLHPALVVVTSSDYHSGRSNWLRRCLAGRSRGDLQLPSPIGKSRRLHLGYPKTQGVRPPLPGLTHVRRSAVRRRSECIRPLTGVEDR
jgi:hypothetical protein